MALWLLSTVTDMESCHRQVLTTRDTLAAITTLGISFLLFRNVIGWSYDCGKCSNRSVSLIDADEKKSWLMFHVN